MNVKHFFKFTVLLVLLFFISSCKKKNKPQFKGDNCVGNCYRISGSVLDKSTGTPLSSVQLRIYLYRTGYILFGSRQTFLGRIYTNTDGSFNFSFDAKNYKDPRGYFFIEADLDNFLSDEFLAPYTTNQKQLIEFKLDSTKINKPQKFAINLYQKAILNLNIKANGPTNVSAVAAGIKFNNNKLEKFIRIKGKLDTTLKFTVAGDAKTYVIWRSYDSSVQLNKIDSISIPRGSEKNYSIVLP